MTSNLITAVTTLRESMAALRLAKGGDLSFGVVRAGKGNPYHDQEGKFTGPGGSSESEHQSKRKARLRRRHKNKARKMKHLWKKLFHHDNRITFASMGLKDAMAHHGRLSKDIEHHQAEADFWKSKIDSKGISETSQDPAHKSIHKELWKKKGHIEALKAEQAKHAESADKHRETIREHYPEREKAREHYNKVKKTPVDWKQAKGSDAAHWTHDGRHKPTPKNYKGPDKAIMDRVEKGPDKKLDDLLAGRSIAGVGQVLGLVAVGDDCTDARNGVKDGSEGAKRDSANGGADDTRANLAVQRARGGVGRRDGGDPVQSARTARVGAARQGRADNKPGPVVMGRNRTQKSSSAESILHHCLQRRGWLKRWRAGKLTGLQHLKLLSDIRKYGRAWLRHEAEMFFRVHGVKDGSEGAKRDSARGESEGQTASTARASSSSSSLHMQIRTIGGSLLNPLRRWFDRAAQFVRELVFAGTMAMAGTESISADDIAAAEQQTRKQHEYLEKFRRELETNPPPELAAPKPAPFGTTTIIVGEPKPMSRNQAIARAELYGNAAWEAGQKTARREARVIPAAKFERRILGHPKTHHCEDCPPLAALGWVPVGTLPDIGDTECGGMCLCRFAYSDDNQAKVSHVPRKVKDSRRKPELPKEDEAGGSLLKGDKAKPEPPTKPKPKPEPARPDYGEDAGGPFYDADGNVITYHFEGP